jgi:hypothetical protein
MNLKIYEVLLRKMLIDGFLRKKKKYGVGRGKGC